MDKERNWVAKHARRFNRAAVYRDRKRDAKRGYRKHRGGARDSAWGCARADTFAGSGDARCDGRARHGRRPLAGGRA